MNPDPNLIKTEYFSGDMANIILMQRKIKKWYRNANEMIKKNHNIDKNGVQRRPGSNLSI